VAERAVVFARLGQSGCRLADHGIARAIESSSISYCRSDTFAPKFTLRRDNMRRAIGVVVGLGVLMWTGGAVRAQNPFGGLGDAVKKGATDAAKQEVDQAVGVPGA